MLPNSQKATLMLGSRSKRMASITATLPILILDRIDDLIAKDKIPSRSYLIREAVARYLKEIEQK
jgi:metal-responsive CopG/Arc/MetJ family transcriptional regulator